MKKTLATALVAMLISVFGLVFFSQSGWAVFWYYVHVSIGLFINALLAIYLPEHLMQQSKSNKHVVALLGWLLVLLFAANGVTGIIWFFAPFTSAIIKNLHLWSGWALFVVFFIHCYFELCRPWLIRMQKK